MTDRELMQMANRIEALAFEMKAPNAHTPQFVMLANEIRARARLAQPEPWQQLEWDEVFDCATNAYCRSSASKETLRLCFQHRNPQQEQVVIPWTANELMDFAKGIASIYNTPPVRQADSEPVAWMHPEWNTYTRAPAMSITPKEDWIPLYTAPPQREFIGLTDEEEEQIVYECWDDPPLFIEMIQAKLKEKNT